MIFMRKYRLFGLIPIFDIVVVLILAVAFFIGYKVVNTSKTGTAYITEEKHDAVITVKFVNVSNQIIPNISEGDTVTDMYSNNVLGTVISYEKKPSLLNDFDNIEGNPIVLTYEDKSDITLKIKSAVTLHDYETLANGTKIGIANSLACSLQGFCGTGVVTNIELG